MPSFLTATKCANAEMRLFDLPSGEEYSGP